MKCGICRRDKNTDDMKHIVLTDEERAFVKRMQGIDETEYWCCKPCYAVLSDKQQGAQLIKGTLQVNLTAAGVRDPEKYAKKVYDMLIDKSAKKPVS
jgi:hypothetical protein